MNKHSNGIKDSMTDIADDTRALLAATADVAEEKVMEARKRLSSAMDAAKDTYTLVQKKVVTSAKAADKMVHANPYQAIGVAFAIGALVGYFARRRG